MKYSIFLFLSFIFSNMNAFIVPYHIQIYKPYISYSKNNINKHKYNYYDNDINIVINNSKNIISKIKYPIISKINMNSDFCPEYINKISTLLNEEQSEIIVKKISNLFPKMDIISHYVLHTNDVMINNVLNNEYLNLDTKKDIVLFLIKFTQFGDSSGSHILQLYHDIVNCLL